MVEVTRLVDPDPSSLAARVRREVAGLPEAQRHVVSTTTLWYTGRPPVHQAVVLRAA